MEEPQELSEGIESASYERNKVCKNEIQVVDFIWFNVEKYNHRTVGGEIKNNWA